MPKKIDIEKWLAKHTIRAPRGSTVIPFENGGRMDDPAALDQRKDYRDQRGEPVTVIQTITDKEMRRLSGSEPQATPQVIRVNSPGLTTQPILSFERRDIKGEDTGRPTIRVLEGGKGVPDTMPFVNPYTLTGTNLSHSSLLEPGKADSKGQSTTKNYDELRNRMGNMKINIDGMELDILLPCEVDPGTRMSIGGVDARLHVKSDEAKSDQYNPGKEGEKKASKPLHWDGNKDGGD
jgi:hypothetical protein